MTNPKQAPKQPSLIPGISLLTLGAVLIIVLLINPNMSPGTKAVIAVLVVLVVLALLAFAIRMWLKASRPGGSR
ncbi:hypothetical protein EH165_08460 [Nakamurella antarctica]|uniref:Uncharacterized protein n=1 Tax=Nakamurella antarctica TaxID=1902245 RepID=A0A3G8ZLG1_9ACTN|nr:hypothetical protein [Nakamurella antarctica]AZI58169.1 hypothetical protein EH165_08460 [Nakamurella antarctica]